CRQILRKRTATGVPLSCPGNMDCTVRITVDAFFPKRSGKNKKGVLCRKMKCDRLERKRNEEDLLHSYGADASQKKPISLYIILTRQFPLIKNFIVRTFRAVWPTRRCSQSRAL